MRHGGAEGALERRGGTSAWSTTRRVMPDPLGTGVDEIRSPVPWCGVTTCPGLFPVILFEKRI
ncbi:hypothetical protein CEP50_09800 [Actinopolyspora mortivallis]|uniref:Uncharacterized protein n=1 Tax=Actinopolyspora mortivallis TaxID=33906 RepID=A0A2T0GWW9_ACTMO|nr:hypothetical protein CEP50_09800 [Actinopolyspora mortivallis]